MMLPSDWGYCRFCKAAGCDWCGGYGFCPLKYGGVSMRLFTPEMRAAADLERSRRSENGMLVVAFTVTAMILASLLIGLFVW